MKWLLALLGLILALSSVMAASPGLTVFGEGSAVVPADIVTITVGVESSNQNATLAAAENSELLNKTTEALKAAGVKDEEILPGSSSSVTSGQSFFRSCQTVNNNTTCQVIASNASSVVASSVVIRLMNADEGRINQVIETAKAQGAYASVLDYSLSDSGPAMAAARTKAIENAKSNAQDYATAAGVKLGKVLDISEYGYPDVWLLGSGSLMDELFGRSEPTGMVEVKAYVVVTYEIL